VKNKRLCSMSWKCIPWCLHIYHEFL